MEMARYMYMLGVGIANQGEYSRAWREAVGWLTGGGLVAGAEGS